MKILYFLFFMLIFSHTSYANFYTTPNKIQLNSDQNVTTVYLVNQSDKAYAFVIKAVDFKMNEKGKIKPLESEHYFSFSAKDKIKFLPKALKLSPHERGAIKIIRSKRHNVDPGSYHVHLNIQRKALFQKTAKGSPIRQNKTAMHIEVEYDINVPLFIDYDKPKKPPELSFAHRIYADPKDKDHYKIALHIKNKTRFLERLEVSLLNTDSRSTYDEVWHSKISAYPEVPELNLTKKIPRSQINQQDFWLMIQDNGKIIKYEKVTIH